MLASSIGKTPLLAEANNSAAVEIFLSVTWAAASLAVLFAVNKSGMDMEANRAMMPTTTIISTKVNPALRNSKRSHFNAFLSACVRHETLVDFPACRQAGSRCRLSGKHKASRRITPTSIPKLSERISVYLASRGKHWYRACVPKRTTACSHGLTHGTPFLSKYSIQKRYIAKLCRESSG